MPISELGPAERFAAGAIGSPGRRRFYLSIVAGGQTFALLTEKEQIAALAARGLEVLEEHGISSDDGAVERILEEGLEIADPGEGGEDFRVGSIAIGLSPSELLTVTVESAEGEDGVNFIIAPEQFRAMAVVALEVVASGRPTCPWCRLPMDPEGHHCPAQNGHRRP